MHQRRLAAVFFGRGLRRTVLAGYAMTALTSLAAAATETYRVEPYTSQQTKAGADGTSTAPAARFLTLLLPLASGPPPTRYEHRLPARARNGSVVELKVRARHLFEGRIARTHPFEPGFKRVLMYWGCGAALPAGQPRVIRSEGMDEQALTQLLAARPSTASSGADPLVDAEGHVAYFSAMVPPNARMAGSHELRAGSQRASLAVDPGGEFLPPIAVLEARIAERGEAVIRWQHAPGTAAYFANLFIQLKNSPDLIIWTSSRVPESGYLLAREHPGGRELLQLRNDGILLPADTRECAVPSEVIRHAPLAMAVQLHGYAPEATATRTSRDAVAIADSVRILPRVTATILLAKPQTTVDVDRRATRLDAAKDARARSDGSAPFIATADTGTAQTSRTPAAAFDDGSPIRP